MARVFYHRPLFAILDECTSAVSSEVENKIYETCRTLGITIFTVSHRESLRIHHNYILRIEGIDGAWSMTKIDSLSSSSSSS
jgi:ATP-binding cassette, subfamily D (ALD), member 3